MLCYEGTYNRHIWIIFLSPGHFLLHFVFLDVLISIQHSLFYPVLRFQFSSVHFSRSVMSDSATTWTTACQASLSITNSWNLLKLKSIESVMPSNYLILCYPLLLLPLIFPSIRVFFNESALHIRWPKYWSFSFNISPCQELAREIPSMTRSCGGGLTSNADQESRDPLDLLEHVPQNQNLSVLLFCAFHQLFWH